MTAADPLSLLEDVVARARRQGADAADAMLVSSESLESTCRLGKLEALQHAEERNIGLRVFRGKRQAVVSSSDLSPKALDALLERALAMAQVVPDDPFCGLADPGQIASSFPDLEGFDPTRPSAEALTQQALETEDAARAIPGVANSEGANAGWRTAHVCIVASNGFSFSCQRSHSGLGVSVLAGAAQAMETDFASTSAVFRDDLETPADIGRLAGERAVKRLGSRRIKTTRVPVIFESRVARGLLGHFLNAVNGASVARGTTFLKDALGTSVFAKGISIVEDPFQKRGLASQSVDAEGIAPRRRSLIDDGVLTSWLLDLRSARRLGLNPTGHAGRGVSSLPSPTATNVWLEPGAATPEELIAETGEGLYVTTLFGHGINSVTGDYSRGCAGFWIEKGAVAYPVSEITVAGNLRAMFHALTPANDLKRRRAVEAPTCRIDGMTLAGE